MAPIVPDPAKIRPFKTEQAFEAWLSKHHDREDEIWLRVYKKDSGVPSINCAQALDVVLCWGWIDGLRKGFDDKSFLQRYSPRTKKSVWSQINVDNVARLIKQGRMTEHGLREVEAAKADGRWARAYRSKGAAVPADLQAAIDAEPKARRMFDKLSAQNRFALVFRTQNMKTEAGRRRKIESFVDMLRRGKTIYPQKGVTSPSRGR